MSNLRHGMARSRLYNIWKLMKRRCNNPKDNVYKYYGGKGIKVCQEWEKFIPFMEWAHNNGYTDELTIDRIEGDKDYSPDNCRWITQSENSRIANVGREGWKKGKFKYIEFNGQSKTKAEWAEELGVTYATINIRLNRGWSLEKTLSTPNTKKSS
jgi:hypothetical protein